MIALLLYWKELIRSIKRFNEKDFEQTAIIGFLTLAANVMAGIFLASISVRNENEIAIDSMTDHNVILFKFAAILFAPVVEELVFRHGIYSLFGKRHFLGCIITTFLFALGHVWIEVLVYGQWSQLIVMIPYLATGLGLNIAYQRTQNVMIYPILLHMVINAIGTL